MRRTQTARVQDSATKPVLYMVMELSVSQWLIGFGDRSRDRKVSVPAWSCQRILEEVDRAKEKFGLPPGTRVLCAQEAGRDGFSIHRFLLRQGIESLVVDSSSIEVPRRSRRTKTDRVDAEALLRLLRRYAGGETKAWRVLHVPTEEEELARRSSRELKRLQKERTSLTNRMRSILATQGIVWRGKIRGDFSVEIRKVRRWDGGPIPDSVLEELDRALERWGLIEEQVDVLERSRRQAIKEKKDESARITQRLMRLKGIGETGATILAQEFFWRKFSNRREVGGAAGLVTSPYISGELDHNQGISKAGNGRVRALVVELSWSWLRWQPWSDLSQWFEARFGGGSRRYRRVGIVALARKLLIALWRYLEKGEVPQKATLTA